MDIHRYTLIALTLCYKTPVFCSWFCYRTRVMGGQSFTLREYEFSTFLAPVTLTFTRWPSYTITNLTRIAERYMGCENINSIRRGFRKLSSDKHTDRQTSYAWSLPVTWQRWGSHRVIRHSQNPMLYANLVVLSVTEPELWAIDVYIAGMGISEVFGSCDLDLDPMTFIYELDPYCLEIYRMCKYDLPKSGLSKIIVWQTDRHTYIHTE